MPPQHTLKLEPQSLRRGAAARVRAVGEPLRAAQAEAVGWWARGVEEVVQEQARGVGREECALVEREDVDLF